MFSSVVTAVSNLLSGFLNFKTEKLKNIACIEVIEDKQDYKKALNIAEKIIAIAENYKSDMTFAHRLKFCHLVDDFKKNN